MRIQTALAQYDVGESMDGNLRVQLVGAGTIQIAPTGDQNAVIILAPSNRRPRYKTGQQRASLASLEDILERNLPNTWAHRQFGDEEGIRAEAKRLAKIPDAPEEDAE